MTVIWQIKTLVQIKETEQLHKNGDKLTFENFRAILILDVAYKVLSQINCRRLPPLHSHCGSQITPEQVDRVSIQIKFSDSRIFPGYEQMQIIVLVGHYSVHFYTQF